LTADDQLSEVRGGVGFSPRARATHSAPVRKTVAGEDLLLWLIDGQRELLAGFAWLDPSGAIEEADRWELRAGLLTRQDSHPGSAAHGASVPSAVVVAYLHACGAVTSPPADRPPRGPADRGR
jgi:hypothetical protein